MKRELLHTPEGVRDIYNEECEKKLVLEKNMMSMLKTYGYHPIQTPMFEFFDIFAREIGSTSSRELYKFFDREGNTLVLRPDITPSIARCAAKYFSDTRIPLRFCYNGNTFINNLSYQGRLKECTQAGAELIGDASVDADAEMIALAKSVGANGINVAGVCCTSNEVAMRRGVPMAGNFLQQENVVLTGACEAIVVDVQCIFPALGPLSKCFHTKFITTSPIAQMPDSDFIRFNAETAGENARNIVRTAVENFVNRNKDLVYIPQLKQKATVGYSTEAIVKVLDGVTNSQVDVTGTTKPLIECITSGVLRGAAAMVGCNNPKVRADHAHIELMKKLIANDVIVILSGCSAQAAARAGLMDKEAKNLCGAGLKRVCELADIPPVLHMGSCVDISRMMVLASQIAKDSGLNISQLPLVGCAPEWMSEKAVSIGNYVVATGIDTFLGVDPQVSGSDQMVWWLTEGIRDWVEAAYTVETDTEKLGDAMLARIEEKRAALGI